MSKVRFDFLEGGGKAGEEIRNFDWEKTSLGNPDEWPVSLKISICLMLDSAVPIQILWGKDFISFYNDLKGKLLSLDISCLIQAVTTFLHGYPCTFFKL